MTHLPTPGAGNEVAWVAEHLGHLTCDVPARSGRFVGTQAAADSALATLDITGYAKRRNEVEPVRRRGATALSPFVRYGLLTLPQLWDAVGDAPSSDRQKFRDELLWQEYARHLYARLGTAMAAPLRYDPLPGNTVVEIDVEPWDRTMACVDTTVTELERDGWLVNQTRMWLASHWTVRSGADWRVGEDRFFRHLLDGSRAANRLGWQWTIGAGTGKPYGFSRWQVEKRAPGRCSSCVHRNACPIESWPPERTLDAVPATPLLDHDPHPSRTGGPRVAAGDSRADVVWMTAESMGDDDPALAAHPDLPVLFVFDEPLLGGLQLSGKRLVFFVERLAELSSQRTVEVHLGTPADVLAGSIPAVTFAPVPGFRRISSRLPDVQLHPWPWLRIPGPGTVRSFTGWVRSSLRSR